MNLLLATPPVPPFDPLGLPAPTWVFEFLLALTMLLHLLFMNMTLGGAIVATVLDVLTLIRRGNHNLTVRVIWQMLPVTFSFTITTGVAPLLFVQVLYGQFFYTANIFLGFVWFALVPLLIVAFYLTYFLVYRLSSVLSNRLGRWDRAPGKRLPFSAACAVLFLAASLILTSNHMLSIQPDQWAQGGEWVQNRLAVTPVITHTRLAHNDLGAVAVCGLWLAAVGWWRRWRQVDPPEVAARITATGLWVALPVMVVTAVFGLTFFFLLPGEVRGGLLRPGVYPVLWWLGLLALVGQIFHALMALQRPQEFRWFAGLAGCAVVTVVGMVAAREAVRLGHLARDGLFAREVWQQNVNTQPSPLILFVAMLVITLATVGWLLWVSARARPAAGQRAA
jgi:hypothetical protein